MADVKLDGGVQRQRSMLVPILLALLVLAAAGAWFAKVYVHPSVTGAVDRIEVFPVHVEYKRGTGMLVGADQTEDALYVVADIALSNRSEVPLFLSSFSGRFTMQDDTIMEANIIEKDDLPRLMAMFPKLKSIVEGVATTPLLRESSVPKNTDFRGYVVMSYNVPQAVWDKRKSAEVRVDFYHQDRLTMALPK